MKIEYSKRFIKDFRSCPSFIKTKFKIRLEIFIEDKNNLILNNHELLGELKGYRSFNITGDWRTIFQELDSEIAYFVTIGTHSQFYK